MVFSVFLYLASFRVEPFFVFDGFGEPARVGVMITTVELVDGICRLVETVHGIGSEFLFFTRIEFVLYLTPVTVIEKVHPVKHECIDHASWDETRPPGVVGRMVRWAWVDPCSRDIAHWRRIQ